MARLRTAARSAKWLVSLGGALSGLGWVLYRENKINEAELHLQESVESARASEDAWTLANALESFGRFMHYQGRSREASACLEESVAIARGLGIQKD